MLPGDRSRPLPQSTVLPAMLVVVALLAVGCTPDPEPEPEDPRVTAQWAAPAACGATPYTWIRDPAIGTVLDWEEDQVLDYSAAVLESALAASGFRIEKPFLYDARVFRFRYVTQDRGGLAEATSTLVVPVPAAGDPTSFPLLAYLHGTAGFSDRCAPSANLIDPLVAAALASIGHVVVGPDYLGMVSMGSPSPHVHPYLVSEPTALSSADAVRAGRLLLPELDLDTMVTVEPGLSVLGASQGGHAALALAWYAPYYAPELEISGVAASVPPADLLTQAMKGTAQRINATSNLLAFLGAYADWYGADLSHVLLPPHDTHVPVHLATECNLGGITSSATDVAEIFTPAFMAQAAAGFPDDGDAWNCMMRVNSFPSLGLEPLELPPTLFVLSEEDDLVDTPIERDSFDALCGRGWDLQYLECAGVGHEEGAVGSFAEQIDFLADRRAGADWPAADQCARTPPVVCSGTDVN